MLKYPHPPDYSFTSSPGKFRPEARKTITFFCLWGALFLVLLVITPLHRTYVELHFYTDTESFIHLYWTGDFEDHIEKNVSFVRTEKGTHVYRFYIDFEHEITRLLINPTHKPSTVNFFSLISIKQPGFADQVLKEEQLGRLEPISEIKRFQTERKNAFRFISTGNKPMLSLNVNSVELTGIKKYKGICFKALMLAGLSLLISLAFFLIFSITKIARAKVKIRIDNALSISQINNWSGDNSWPYGSKLLRHLTTAAFVIVMVLLVYQLIKAYQTSNIFGTHSAPNSDAFVWLKGAIHYLDGLSIKTYRPTINIFFASIYSCFERTNHIPLFSICYFLVNVSAIFIAARHLSRTLIVMVVFLFLLFFNQIILPLNVGQLMVEFLPFSMTLIGIVLLSAGLKDNNTALTSCYLGLALIGVAIALRGVQLVGGGIIALMAAALLWQNKNRIAAAAAPIVLLLPLVLDVYLQKKYGAENNGIFSFFCFYHETAHSYTSAGKIALRNLQITNTEVLVTYIRFLFSPQGVVIFSDYLNEITQSILKIIFNKYFYLILSISVAFSIANNKNKALDSKTILLITIHFIVLPAVYLAAPEKLPFLFFIYSCLLAWLTFLFRQYMTCMFLIMYVGGTILFAMMGMPGGLRVSSNFIFCLPIALICLFLEPEGEGVSFKRLPMKSLIIMNSGCLLFLYVGGLILPQPSVATLKPETAIKIAADKTKNVSMYYTESGEIFYAAEDGKGIGFTRPYNSIICPDGKFGGSIKSPCKLE